MNECDLAYREITRPTIKTNEKEEKTGSVAVSADTQAMMKLFQEQQ